METEKPEPTPSYVAHFKQSDGTTSQVDFSAPGEFGDFAFYHLPESGSQQYFYSYHTNTSAIFEYFLSVMAAQSDASQQFNQLTKRLEEFKVSGMVETTSSETSFNQYHLEIIRNLIEQRHLISSYDNGDLSLKEHPGYTVCTMKEHNRSVEIPHDQLWKFVAGMAWRSYGDPEESYSYKSRHSTQTLKAALVAATEGLMAREVPDQD